MKGRTLMIGSLVLLVAFGTALWWFQTRAYYTELPVVDALAAGDQSVAVKNFRGINASSSPIKLRACMELVPEDAAALPPAPYAEPLVAPGWFDCFDAKLISRALTAGEAQAYSLGLSEFQGTERILAVMPDGRAWLWHQLTQEYANQ